MAGKNTAAFGIYRDEASVRHAVETLQRQGFRSTDISVLFPEISATKTLLTRKQRKRRKALRLGLAQVLL